MSDLAFVSHLVSQTRANIAFLQAQGYLTVDDATAMRSKLTAAISKTSAESADTPAPDVGTQAHNRVPTYQQRPPQPPQPTPDYARARALWAYNEDGREQNDLTMSVGDIIDVVEETNPDWWTGRNRGKQGLFPSNYVQKLPQESSQQRHQEKAHDALGYSDNGNPPPQQQVNIANDAPAVDSAGLQPDEGQDRKKKKFGKFGNTMAHSAAGGLGFGAGAAVGSGIINALF